MLFSKVHHPYTTVRGCHALPMCFLEIAQALFLKLCMHSYWQSFLQSYQKTCMHSYLSALMHSCLQFLCKSIRFTRTRKQSLHTRVKGWNLLWCNELGIFFYAMQLCIKSTHAYKCLYVIEVISKPQTSHNEKHIAHFLKIISISLKIISLMYCAHGFDALTHSFLLLQ